MKGRLASLFGLRYSFMDDKTLWLIIVLTTVGFCLLAFILLAPVYLFLKRERKAGEEWTDAVQQHRLREETRSSNGSSAPPQEESESL